MTSAPRLVGPIAGEPSTPRELRAVVRAWRRGRADTSWLEVAQDAYIAVFSTLLIGAMAGNVVFQLRRLAVDECLGTACLTGRATAPWLTVPVVLALIVGTSRVVGPVAVTPAVASWVLPAPIDRGRLLRPRLTAATAAAVLIAALSSGVAAAVAGAPLLAAGGLALATAGLAGGGVGFCAWAQARHDAVTRAVGVALTGIAWLLLLAVTLGHPPAPPAPSALGWTLALIVTTTLAVAAVVAGGRALTRVPGRSVATAGAFAPSLSGALAAMDVALMWDVLHARRWRSRGWVRPHRGRWRGPTALAQRDLVRLRRTPALLVAPAGAVLVPYLAATLGGQRIVVFVAAATGFVAGLRLFAGLRVLRRTSILERCLPLRPTQAGLAAIAVPALVLLGWSLAVGPALGRGLEHPGPRLTLLTAVVVALASTTACVRWMAARPPDYRMALVSSPAGAIPPALIGALLRGPDILLLVTAPLLLVPTVQGALVAVVVGGLALLAILSRRP